MSLLKPPPSCRHDSDCPISHSPCAGECAFALVMHSANLGVLLFEAEQRRVVFVNPEAKALFAAAGDPQSWQDFDRLLSLEQARLVGGEGPWQPPPISANGRFIGYSVYSEGPFVWAFARDITDRERLEAVAGAVESMNNLGFIFNTVRHEIGNPINSVKMALSVLRENFDRFPRATAVEYIERSLEELTRVEDLLATLRSFSLFEVVRPRSLDLRGFLADFARLVRPGLASRGVELAVSPSAGPLPAQVDPRALHQVLLNLTTNGADAAAGRPDARVRLTALEDGELVRIHVTDNGVGIPAEQRAHLFRPFVTTKAHGTGLGLVIVKKLVVSMLGTIELDSEVGVGTSVRLTFPRG